MRFLRRKGRNEESETQIDNDHSYSPLGIFSPAAETRQQDPLYECKKMAELDSIFIRSKRLESLDDVPFVVNQVRDGNIVLLDITSLNDGRDQTHLELKRIIERIRGETRGYRADIALVNDNCVIVAPSFIKL